jgi:hypothetical protein
MGEDETAVTLSPTRLEIKGFLEQLSIPHIDQGLAPTIQSDGRLRYAACQKSEIELRSNLS